MVDAAMSFRNLSAGAAAARTRDGRAGRSIAILPPGDIAAYAELAKTGVHAPAQSPLWVEEWVANVGPDGFIAVVEWDGKPGLALALEVVRSGPFRVARLMGGSHANGNFPAADPEFLRAGPVDWKALFAAVRASRPEIDALVLERLLPEMGGLANPLLALPSFPSPNIALAIGLDGGFDVLLSRNSSRRKKKKHRAQMRKYEAAGGFRRIEAATPEEVSRLLDAFFAMKESRFRKLGVADVFGELEVRNFFRSLFRDALAESPPPFVLHALEVGGKPRAVTGSSLAPGRIVCEFGGITDDELAAASPGEFLNYENIDEACRQGFKIYDFSVGDEPYKRLWCDIEMRHFDAVAPLTAKGHVLALALRLKAGVKAGIKNSPTLWKLVKLLRSRAAGKQPSPKED